MIKEPQHPYTRCWSTRFPGRTSTSAGAQHPIRARDGRRQHGGLPVPSALPVGDGDLRNAAAALPGRRPPHRFLLSLCRAAQGRSRAPIRSACRFDGRGREASAVAPADHRPTRDYAERGLCSKSPNSSAQRHRRSGSSRSRPGVDLAVGGLPVRQRSQAGEAPWDYAPLQRMKERYEAGGFKLVVIEARPPLNKAKRGLPGRDEEIATVCTLLENMGRLGIPVWCYEWMTDFNWVRTNMSDAVARRLGGDELRRQRCAREHHRRTRRSAKRSSGSISSTSSRRCCRSPRRRTSSSRCIRTIRRCLRSAASAGSCAASRTTSA